MRKPIVDCSGNCVLLLLVAVALVWC